VFVAIDVETANADVGSICQIGIAEFGPDGLTAEWTSLVNPESFFDFTNVAIHGIRECDVSAAPTFLDVSQAVTARLRDQIVICHTAFDRSAIKKVAARYQVPEPTCTWLDSARVARRIWAQFAQRGYGLANLAKFLDYDFQHHDALEDAKAVGYIVLAAMQESGLDIDALVKRVNARSTRFEEQILKEGDPDGPLYGEQIVFTGVLQMSRAAAAELAAKLGCTVHPRVTKKTTLLVVGDQDLDLLAGHEKSSKHRRAEELIGQGIRIRILREGDFQQLLELG
jgi:DNA polymerase-3 subunit epsilon